MRFVWMVFAGLVVLMALVLPQLHRHVPAAGVTSRSVSGSGLDADSREDSFQRASLRERAPGTLAQADSIVAFGLEQRGTPYVYAGTSPVTGFDCSGFIMYTFGHFGVPMPHSTAMLINVGQPIARSEAQPGDIVVFTGTADSSTTPGHAGIVITKRGEVPLRFVHASSGRRDPGVKVSQLEGTDYVRRFMQVRRVLGPGQPARSRPVPAPVRPVARIPSLPSQPVTIMPAEPLAKPLPPVLKPMIKATAPVRKHLRVPSKAHYSKAKAASPTKRVPASKKTMAKKASTKKKTVIKPVPAKRAVARKRKA